MSASGRPGYSWARALMVVADRSQSALPARGREVSTRLGQSSTRASVGQVNSSQNWCRTLARERQQSDLAGSGMLLRVAGRWLNSRERMAHDIGGSGEVELVEVIGGGLGKLGGAAAGVHLYAVGKRGAAPHRVVSQDLPSGTSLMQWTQAHTECSFIHHCGGM